MTSNREKLTGAAAQRLNPSSWIGLQNPDKIFTFPVNGERRDFVLAALAQISGYLPSNITALLDYDRSPETIYRDNAQGRYLIIFEQGSLLGHPSEMVLHVKPRIDETTYDLSDKVYNALHAEGIQSPRLVRFGDGTATRKFRDFFIAFTTYLPGRHLKSENEADMVLLGTGLAQLQKAFIHLPQDLINSIDNNAQTTRTLIAGGYNYALSDKGFVYLAEQYGAENARKIQEAAHSYKERDQDSFISACHGDLIPGNVIVTRDNGQVAFLDFDNISGSLFPHGFDVGMASFRIGLNSQQTHSVQTDLSVLKQILSGYRQVISNARLDDILSAMRLATSCKVFGVLGQKARAIIDEPKVKKHIDLFLSCDSRIAALLPYVAAQPEEPVDPAP